MPRPALLLAKPLTFMNRSGDAVAALARYYDIAAGRSAGGGRRSGAAVRTAAGAARAGSAGGHNGLKSVIERLGTTEFPRLRLGVGRGDARRDLADHVLSKFEPGERAELESFIARAADAAEMFAAEGIDEGDERVQPGRRGVRDNRLTPCRVRASGQMSRAGHP